MPTSPNNEGEIIELVRRARATGRRLRVHGARHSVAPAIRTGEHDGFELSPARLAAVHVEGSRAVVGGGAQLGLDPLDALDALDRDGRTRASLLCKLADHRRALPNLAGVSSQTLAGFLATGSAGGSFSRSLADTLRRVRFVDGTGEIHDVTRGDPLFPLVGTSLGLLGVVTELELETEPAFDVVGEESVVDRDRAPFDLRAPGSLASFLASKEYARVLWWPQPGVQRFTIWSAERATRPGPIRPYQPLPMVLGRERPMQRLAALGLRAIDGQPDPRWAKLVLDAFVNPSVQRFRDRWDRALAMDNTIDQRTLPVEFAEFWFPADRVHEALARLDDLFVREGFAATSNFAVELYAGPDSPFVLNPGHRQPSVRINVFHSARNRTAAAARFAGLWQLFADLAPRLHWGKHLPPPPIAHGWVARAWPELDSFLAARAELDPDGVFLSNYFRERLGVRERPARSAASPASNPAVRPAASTLRPIARARGTSASPARAHRVWPMAFDLEPVGLEFPARAQRSMVYTADAYADPDFLFDAFVTMREGQEWMEQFVAMHADSYGPAALFDEVFTFMSLRGRTLVFERPHRWVARIEACSLPVAKRMLEELELQRQPDGRAHLRWTFHFDPHPLTAPVEPALTRIFDRLLLQKSLNQLAGFAERSAGIRRMQVAS